MPAEKVPGRAYGTQANGFASGLQDFYRAPDRGWICECFNEKYLLLAVSVHNPEERP